MPCRRRRGIAWGLHRSKTSAFRRDIFSGRYRRPGASDLIAAPEIKAKMDFALGAARSAPAGMVPVPGGNVEQDIRLRRLGGPYRTAAVLRRPLRSDQP